MNKGWECPKCGACYSPVVLKCDHCTKNKMPDSSWNDGGNGEPFLTKRVNQYGYNSPHFCEHANEVPATCPCPRDCYCYSPNGGCRKRGTIPCATDGCLRYTQIGFGRYCLVHSPLGDSSICGELYGMDSNYCLREKGHQGSCR